MIRSIPLTTRIALDVSGAMAGISAFMGYIPAGAGGIASILACIWYSVQLYYFFKNRKVS